MAILDGLKNAVTANVARSANKVAVNGLRNIVGNVFGVDLNPTNPAAALTNRPTKFTTKNLAYPAGVESDDQQGHYIIFEILEQNKAKLKSTKDGTKSDQTRKTIESEYDPVTGYDSKVIKAQEELNRERHLKSKNNSAKKSQSIQLSQKATTRISTMIALYMPASISVKYSSKYGEQNIGSAAAAGEGALAAFAGRNGAGVGTALKGAGSEAVAGAELGALNAVDTVADGTKAIVALEKGAIRTPRMELMFEGIGRREFSYEFTFIPKSEAEAQTIKDIVYQFKFHMASQYTTGTFREMSIPSMFNISYKYKSADNDHLNKISTCALENMDISYGAERFVAYEDGVPQTTKITLSFKEMEIITKDKIMDGF